MQLVFEIYPGRIGIIMLSTLLSPTNSPALCSAVLCATPHLPPHTQTYNTKFSEYPGGVEYFDGESTNLQTLAPRAHSRHTPPLPNIPRRRQLQCCGAHFLREGQFWLFSCPSAHFPRRRPSSSPPTHTCGSVHGPDHTPVLGSVLDKPPRDGSAARNRQALRGQGHGYHGVRLHALAHHLAQGEKARLFFWVVIGKWPI